MKMLKTELAQWLVDNHDDCNRDTYFNSDLRCAISTDDSYKKFMREFTKEELISSIFDHSFEGQKFLEDNNLI